MRILLFANGPGELMERAYPIARLFKRINRKIAITLIITPCQFSTGKEYDIANTLSVFDEILKFRNLVYIIKKIKKNDIGYIFHLGGDRVYPWLISLLLNIKMYSYGHYFIFSKSVNKFFIQNITAIHKIFKMKKSIPLSKLAYIGNFSISLKKFSIGKNANHLTIGLFPGSRKLQFEHMFPFFLKIAEELTKYLDIEIHFYLYLSPFISYLPFSSGGGT